MAAASQIVAVPVKESGLLGGRGVSSARQCRSSSRRVWISQQGLGSAQWESFGVRVASAIRASPSSSAISSSEARKFSGCDPREQKRRIRLQVAAAREGDEPQEAESDLWSLDLLDKQLKVFSSQENAAPGQIPGDLANEKNSGKKAGPLLQWPEFTTGFFVYAGVGLMLLTIVNNVLYKIFLGPPVVDRRETFVSSVPVTPRFRVKSLEQEREAREAKEAQSEAMAALSREAPSTSE